MGKNSRGILGTSIFHGIILVIVIFFGFIVPDPPPGEEGIMINFGTDDTGFGNEEPMYSEIPEESSPPPQVEATVPEESTDDMITQDFEEAPSLEAEEAIEQVKVEETPVRDVVEEAVETPPPPEEDPPQVNERALYKGRSNTDNTSGSEGITEGEGNQGSLSGTPDSDNYLEGLGGQGINVSLAGRDPVSIPKPDYNVQEEGIVVIKIRVNREGIVTYAEFDTRGSNTLNKELLEAATKAARKARFNNSPDAAFTQQGTITYRFVLQ